MLIDPPEERPQAPEVVIDRGRVNDVGSVQGARQAAVVQEKAIALREGRDERTAGRQPQLALESLIGQLTQGVLQQLVHDAARHGNNSGSNRKSSGGM